jgi:endonuclease/exonuclease/phosphatase (EEP) superfamily protein YafD
MRRLVPTILAGIAVVILLEVAVNVVLRPQEGPAALAAVAETYLLAVGAVAGILAILTSLGSGSAGAPIRLAGAVMIVVAVVRLGGEWWSPTPTPTPGANPAPIELQVMTWNLAAGSRSAADTVAGITGSGADLVALQELTPDVATAIGADPSLRALYPYRILEARDETAGLGC